MPDAPAAPTRLHRPLVVVSAAMAVVAVACAVGLAVDDRTLVGMPIWNKPFKFAVSFVAYGLSMAWILSLLPRHRPGARRAGWWSGSALAVAMVVEMLLIAGQAFRGRQSHFNNATPLDAAVYQTMGGFSLVLWAGTFAVGVLLFRARLADRASAWTLRAGVVLSLAGGAVGGLMGMPAPGQQPGVSDLLGAHSVGVPDGGPGLPLTGWSTVGGDLRVPHFVGLHALQVLPLVLLALAALAPRFPRLADPLVRLRLTVTACTAYGALLALLIWQALRGRPLTGPDTPTLVAAAVVLLLTAAGAFASLRTAPGQAEPPRAESARAFERAL
ncbi:hypothetical protein I3F58_07630 [Streptomyces sp. MUM 203J]|uniref:hypothetical protein n=1 Tax=Streptomyces sp. MUM 203J TaxID=2791990 RepID=UPI001F036670|nr:hypothetical protein [Streptomyces sp. MUM 203J]MCH0539435.1 hypothetical protein [Streptomyces sp. MUM 203J]